MHQAWNEAGRQPTRPEIVVRVNHGFISGHPLESQRQFLTGSVEQVRQDVQQLASWGATEVFFSLRSNLPALEDAFRVILEQMRLLSGVREE